MFKFLLLILVVMSSAAFSQDLGEPESSSKVLKQNSAAEKIDEFGLLAECDRGARLDFLAAKLQEDQNAKGYIIFYQGKNVLPSAIENPNYAKNLYVDYLTQSRGIAPDRIILINSYRNEPITELWIVPKNAAPPKPTDTIAKPKISTDKTLLYASGGIDFYNDSENTLDLLLPAKKAELEVFFKPSEETEKTADVTIPVADSVDPAISPEELEDLKFAWTSETFGAFLEKNKKMQGVIMFYADDQKFDINKVTNHIEEGKQRIVKAAKIVPERIRVIFGGYKNNLEIEFWAVPEKGKFPESKPEERIIEVETEPKIQ